MSKLDDIRKLRDSEQNKEQNNKILKKIKNVEKNVKTIFTRNLTFKSKLILFIRKLVKVISNIEVFNLTGVFVFFILMFYMPWFKAFVIGFFGYLVYLKIENSFIKINKVRK